MITTSVVAMAALLGLYVLREYLRFTKNLKAAKASGITYTIVPFYANDRLYQLASFFLIPLMRRLPRAWTEPWFELTLDWSWNRRYEPFQRFGSDTFIAVSPARNLLYTADADVISQITTRRNDFPKALEVYEMLQIYGDNVVTVEGQKWRHHRKIISPPFSEQNNHLVWAETLDQCQAMVHGWLGGGQEEASQTVRTVAEDAMRLSLYIISRAGFGVRLQWPGGADSQANGTQPEWSGKLEGSHTMSYTNAVSGLLDNIIIMLMLPRFLLRFLPFQTTKVTYTSFIEWGQYMNEMFQSKKAAVMNKSEGDKSDLMIAMIKGAGITPENLEKGEQASPQSLSDQEILGNAFVFMLAGHETTANAIHFCLVSLALNMASQRHLQSDLDGIFQDRPICQWNYDEYVPKLFGSMAGAVMNEVLRLYPPVAGIPKHTAKSSPQRLQVDGKECTVPEDTYIALLTIAAHRNPHQWPSGPPSDPARPLHPLSNVDNDLEEFKPERWLIDEKAKNNVSMSDHDDNTEANNLGVNTAADTSPALYRPPKGAYIPFSEGYRSCIGRRFAQVEILGVIASIFSQYSVELAVDAYASDDEVEKMDSKERREIWEKARQEAERQLKDDLFSVITLQLRSGSIGLRVVKRGGERFNWL